MIAQQVDSALVYGQGPLGTGGDAKRAALAVVGGDMQGAPSRSGQGQAQLSGGSPGNRRRTIRSQIERADRPKFVHEQIIGINRPDARSRLDRFNLGPNSPDCPRKATRSAAGSIPAAGRTRGATAVDHGQGLAAFRTEALRTRWLSLGGSDEISPFRLVGAKFSMLGLFQKAGFIQGSVNFPGSKAGCSSANRWIDGQWPFGDPPGCPGGSDLLD